MSYKVLLPVDGSKLAEKNALAAINFSKKLSEDTTFVLIQVLDITPLLPRDREPEYRLLKEKALDYMNDIKSRVEKEGVMNVEVVVKDGKPAQEICEYAERNNIDLIHMASHGLGKALAWALGSVTYNVIQHSSCPVYMCKPSKKE